MAAGPCEHSKTIKQACNFIPLGYDFDRVENVLDASNKWPRTKASGQVH